MNESTRVTRTLAEVAEDHALVSVPLSERESGYKLAMSPVGVATALVIFAIAGFAVMLAGFWLGLAAGIIVAIVGITLGLLLGNIARVTGVSSTVTSRFFGFGFKGSSLGAIVFVFMILGFLALESALLYEGTILMFNLEDTWSMRIIIYGILTLLWIGLAIFGLNIALKTSTILTVVTLLVTVYIIVEIYIIRGVSPATVLNFEGIVPGGSWPKLEAAIGLIGATAGTITLVTTDFARYCRDKKDVTILALSGPLMQNVIMTVLGAFVIAGGIPEVAEYLMQRNAGLSPKEAVAAAGGFAMGNTGAFFVVFAGWIGFITIYAAQAKAQAINAYSGSLALVNLVDTLFGKKPGRAVMVIVGNIIALLMIAGGILEQFTMWLAYLGCMTMALCGVMISDYYIVRRGKFTRSTHRVENWNWAGIITLVSTALLGIILIVTETFPLGFFVTLLLSIFLYPLLRKILPEGTNTSFISEEKALDAEG